MSDPTAPGRAEAIAVELDIVVGGRAVASHDADGTPCIDVPAEYWLQAAVFLHDAERMDFIDWLSAVDRPEQPTPGVDVVLHVVDSTSRTAVGRLRRTLLRTQIMDDDLRLPSLTSVWPGIAWHERETFEMFGVHFDAFIDDSGNGLRPLLLPDGFEGTPLRKSFVLAARASKAWPGAKEPGESDTHAAPSRRKTLPPGVPEPGTWARPATRLAAPAAGPDEGGSDA
jgi:NADH-quinone oxidoreductase subunit C